MIIDSISIREINESDADKRIINFKERNFIFSEENSTGKTTLLRCIVYGLGYDIPGTWNVDFRNYCIETKINTEDGTYVIVRQGKTIKINDVEYSIDDIGSIHALLFKTDKTEILENLLGTMYFDQEKGWTLLNRGYVIGSNRFFIESYLAGLIDNPQIIDISNEIDQVKADIAKYNSMLSLAKYKQTLVELNGEDRAERSDYCSNPVLEEKRKERRELLYDKKEIEVKRKKLQSVIEKNDKFLKWIADLSLYVKSPSGEEIPVTEDTIVGFKDNELLNKLEEQRLLLLEREYEKKIIDADRIIQEYEENENQLIKGETILQGYDRRVIDLPLDVNQIEKILKRLRNKLEELKKTYSKVAQDNNQWKDRLNSYIIEYAKILDVDGYLEVSNPCMTRNLKKLSGAIFHKLIFIFRISYNKVLSEKLGFNLPFFIDSPSGREIQDITVEETLKLLFSECSGHQMFIASIKRFHTDNDNEILMDGTLFDSVTKQLELDLGV